MKKNKILILVIVTLAAIALVFTLGNEGTTLKDRESGFAVYDTASVTKIFMADMNVDEVLLERKGDGWVINGKSRANTRMVDVLLETMNKVKVKAPVSLASRDNVLRRMATNGKKVEVYQMVYRINLFDRIKFFQHEKLTRVFFVGDNTQDNLGTYMLMEGAENPYIVFIPHFRGYLSLRFSPKPDDWKSHAVFQHKLTDIDQVTVSFTREPANSYIVDVNNQLGNYTLSRLQDGQQVDGFDTLRLLNFLTSFRDLRFESRLNNIMSPVKIDSVINSPSLYEITLVDTKGETTYVKMFEKKAASTEDTGLPLEQIPTDFDRMYALVNDGEDFVLIQYYVFDKVLYPLSHYLL
jgi:hypothetical protein